MTTIDSRTLTAQDLKAMAYLKKKQPNKFKLSLSSQNVGDVDIIFEDKSARHSTTYTILHCNGVQLDGLRGPYEYIYPD